jgi:hypothetical protein
MKNESSKQVQQQALRKTDVSKSFYCANEKKWLDKCKEQCVSCAVEMIRTKAQ